MTPSYCDNGLLRKVGNFYKTKQHITKQHYSFRDNRVLKISPTVKNTGVPTSKPAI